MARFNHQLLVAQRLGMGDVSRAVVAERGEIPWERYLKATIDLRRKERQEVSESPRN